VRLMEYLLTLLSSPDGGVILILRWQRHDSSGAKRLGRRSIGVELTEHNCGSREGGCMSD